MARALATRELEAEQEVKGPRIAERQSAVTQAEKRLKESQDAMTAARLKAESLWAEVVKQNGLSAPEPRSVTASLSSLSPGSSYVAFSASERGLTVVAAAPGKGVVSAVVPEPRAELERKVWRFRVLATDPTSDLAKVAEEGKKLYDLLFPQTIRQAVEGAETLVISPDGPLWEMPFAALAESASPPKFLGLTRPTSLTQSLTIYARVAPRRATSASGALIVGDPIFSRSAAAVKKDAEVTRLWTAGSPPPPLPGTRMEAESIAQMYGVKPVLGEEASEQNVRAAMAGARVIHFATHGFMNPEFPMSSGVLLTLPQEATPPKENDGALQAWEILRHMELDADIVVLSACETGRGRFVQGEGTIGLTRALQATGARAVCSSLWRVADLSSAALMVQFHTGLKAGKPAETALYSAITQTATKYKHPYYWAPFVIVGGRSGS